MQAHDRFLLFLRQSHLDIVRQREVQLGTQITVTDGSNLVHCTVYDNGRVLAQGRQSQLLTLLRRWSGAERNDPLAVDVGPEPDYAGRWSEWIEAARQIGDYVRNNGMPDEKNAPLAYKIQREVLFHDYMFFQKSDAVVSPGMMWTVMRNWFNRYCYMDLDVGQAIMDVFVQAERYGQNDPGGNIPLNAIATVMAGAVWSYCKEKFVQRGADFVCPQVEGIPYDCTRAIIDALYPYSSAGNVVAYNKTNLERLLSGAKDVRWVPLKPQSPIEEHMADGLKRTGLLCIPQYQANDGTHRYRIDFVVRTTRGPMIAIECDGLQYHARAETYIQDWERNRYLQQRGFYVMRFASVEIFNNLDACLAEIDSAFWRVQRGQLTLRDPPRTSYFGVGE